MPKSPLTGTVVSMGPRPEGHGKVFDAFGIAGEYNMFQWGHDPKVMVSPKLPDPPGVRV